MRKTLVTIALVVPNATHIFNVIAFENFKQIMKLKLLK